MNKRIFIPNDVPRASSYFTVGFSLFFENFITRRHVERRSGKNIWNVKGSRNIRLKPAVRAIRLGVLSKFQVRSRIRIQSPTGCWLVETGVRVHQTSNGPAWSFDQAVIPTRLLSRYERDSRSTLNGSGAKKLIIVPSTMAWYQFAFGI